MLKQKEWIDVIVAKTGCSRKEAKIFYDCTFDYMREQISVDEPIKISGFGVLKLRKTAAKEQINLITHQAEIVPEHNVLTFKPYFEIDPKPEPIDVEMAEEEEIVPTVEEVTEETVTEETATEEVVDETPVAEEEPVEEVSEQTQEEPAEEVTDDDFKWLYEGKTCSTSNIKQLLRQRTAFSDVDINKALDVVKDTMRKNGKTTCEVKEENSTFDFIILR